MPIHKGHDTTGYYYQYGQKGKKYYFNSDRTEKIAYAKCLKQAHAILDYQFRRMKMN